MATSKYDRLKIGIQIEDDGYRPVSAFSYMSMGFSYQLPMPMSFFIGEALLRQQLDDLILLYSLSGLHALPLALEKWISNDLGLSLHVNSNGVNGER